MNCFTCSVSHFVIFWQYDVKCLGVTFTFNNNTATWYYFIIITGRSAHMPVLHLLRAHSIGQPGCQPVTHRWPVANGTQLGDQSVTDRRPEIARPPDAGASSLPWISKNRQVIFTPTVRNALQCVRQFRCVLLSAIRRHSELVPLPTKFGSIVTSINTIRHWTKKNYLYYQCFLVVVSNNLPVTNSDCMFTESFSAVFCQ